MGNTLASTRSQIKTKSTRAAIGMVSTKQNRSFVLKSNLNSKLISQIDTDKACLYLFEHISHGYSKNSREIQQS